jgi:hypothetical protein
MISEFEALASKLRQKFPDVNFEVIEDDSLEACFYISVLSSGPDYAPELRQELPESWVFSGWHNPDQRNNMGVIKKSLKKRS